MIIPKRRRFLAYCAASTAFQAAFPLPLFAQTGNRLGRIVVGFPAGGGTDVVARILADKLRKQYPSGMIVENKPGASSRLATEYVKNSEPNGLTMLLTPDFVMTVYPHSFGKLNYDPIKDFIPVSLCARTAYALTAGPGLPANVTSVRQFVQWCKDHPDHASYASTSAGSATHFAGLLLAQSAGIEMLHVAYKGGVPALQDLIGGQIPVSINPIGEVLPHLKAGTLRVLATTGAHRSAFIPNAPTLAESGLKNMVVEAWLGVLLPAKTGEAVVGRLSTAIAQVLQNPDVTSAFAAMGMETASSTPAQFRTLIEADLRAWGPVIKASGFIAEQ